MNNTDYTWFFVFMALFNTNIGLSNYQKNNQQHAQNKQIINKLDEILELLKHE